MLLLFVFPSPSPSGTPLPKGRGKKVIACSCLPPRGEVPRQRRRGKRIFAPTCDAFCDAFCATLNMEISVSVFICDVTIAFFRQYSYNFTIEKV